MNQSAMIGRRCPEGKGGRDCPCCGQAPGRARTAARRVHKRRERQQLSRQLRLLGREHSNPVVDL